MLNFFINFWLKFYEGRSKFNGRFGDRKDYSYMRKNE